MMLASPKRAFITALLVALLHALALLSFRSMQLDRPSSTERLPPVKAWQIFPPQHAPPQEPRGDRLQAGASDRRVSGDRALSRTTKKPSVPTHEETAPSAGPWQSDAANAGSPTDASSERSATGAPLDLTLKPGVAEAVRSSNPAVTDVNPSHRSTAATIGAALVGDSATSIEELGDARVRVRRGSTCYEMARSRISELDPFAQRPAWQTETCRR